MTNREKQILDVIRKEPMISQQSLADQLGIARASVAVHITNLMKKGLIRGKGYVLADPEQIVVVGGANMDIFGFPNDVLRPGVSNPGQVRTSCGGVGRNIADNLARLGQPVTLLTAIGMDPAGETLKESTAAAGVSMDRVCVSSRYPSSVYLAIQERSGDMAWAINQMDIMKEVSVAYLRDQQPLLEKARFLILEGNLSAAALEYLLESCGSVPAWYDPVSWEKAGRIGSNLGRLYAVKPNREESMRLSGISADTREGILANWHWFMEQGVRELWMSLGSEGLFYGDRNQGLFARTAAKDVRNANGAGDALMAGAVHGAAQGLSAEERVVMALASASVACTSHETIHPNFSEALIKQYQNEVTVYEKLSRSDA